MSSASGTAPKGIPILSGPPPAVETSSCVQCRKEFNPLWRRSHTCGHCGYSFCSSCTGGAEALMPRRAGQASTSANPFAQIRDELGLGNKESVNGYETSPVCIPCLGMLQVTSASPEVLRSLPLKRLKAYIEAYNIQCVPLEKEDFVQAIIKSRDMRTGCLSPEAESYYRRKTAAKGSTSGSSTPRQGTQARARPPPNNARPPHSARPQSRPPPPQQQYRPPPQQQYRPPPPQNYRPPPPVARPPSPRPTPARPTPAVAQPPPPIPTLNSLVSLPTSYLSSLSIGVLKAVLFQAHVKVDFSQVLEKDELVKRVAELVTDERKRLERQAKQEQLEAEGLAAGKEASPLPDGTGTAEKVPTGPAPDLDRGACVICQDFEACFAAVDCGHLAMCAPCSELVMATSKECPLCRTRILTPQRLIRIFRV